MIARGEAGRVEQGSRDPVILSSQPRGRVGAVKSDALVGASVAVGEMMGRLLAERNFPVGSMQFVAFERNLGTPIEFVREKHPPELIMTEAFRILALKCRGRADARGRSTDPVTTGSISTIKRPTPVRPWASGGASRGCLANR